LLEHLKVKKTPEKQKKSARILKSKIKNHKMIIEFFPLDITYKETEDKAVIYIYGRTKKGEKICIKDKNFRPYFKVICKEESLEQIKKTEEEKDGQILKVTEIEEIETNILEKKTKAYKIFTNLPKAIPTLKKIIRNIEGVEGTYETDILFVRRYLLDKSLTPINLLICEAEPDNEKSKIPIFEAKSIKQNDELPNPKILAIDIEVYNPLGKHIDMERFPIIMIALYSKNYKKVLTWKRFKTQEKYIEFLKSEAEMIEKFKELTEEFKPDIITGYNSDGFDLPYIKIRAKKYKIKLDFGEDNSELQIKQRGISNAEITGIVHIDVFRFIKRVLGRSLVTDSFTLDAVSKELLGEQKNEIDINELAKHWDESSDKLDEYAKYNLQDTKLTYELLLKVFPNMIEFIKIIGLPLFDINRMSFSQFVEWYCIKQAGIMNQTIPNKPGYYVEQQRMYDRIKGAFVYEPKPGLYEKIAVFDFRSLYPTIIASHNISPGTLNCECCQGKNEIKTERGNFWFCTKKKGFLSWIIEDLITRRLRIKEILKKNKEDKLLKARSEALKVLANSFYGYLAFASARWYCIECAESTTAWARQYIHKVIDTAKEKGFTVLYSDTDSVFLLLEEKSKEDSLKFAEEINKELPGVMELEFENFFKTGIFVSVKSGETGAKKKYALLDEKDKIKVKGFESVRRNWSFIAKEIQKEILEIILREKNIEKAKKYLKEKIKKLREHKIPLDKMIIHTQITKEISSYENRSPHVAAAEMMKKKEQDVFPGMIIKYIVTKGKGLIRDKVKLPEEITEKDYDPEYYIKHQIIPGVDRIFAVLGINITEILSKEGEQITLMKFK
jgi:DNA polymerase, archaea type